MALVESAVLTELAAAEEPQIQAVLPAVALVALPVLEELLAELVSLVELVQQIVAARPVVVEPSVVAVELVLPVPEEPPVLEELLAEAVSPVELVEAAAAVLPVAVELPVVPDLLPVAEPVERRVLDPVALQVAFVVAEPAEAVRTQVDRKPYRTLFLQGHLPRILNIVPCDFSSL